MEKIGESFGYHVIEELLLKPASCVQSLVVEGDEDDENW